ncbi:MAG: hypothetical protein K2W82_15600 [Candidatus Obscuribacterales bacterium]|nr:hypothetical protein [Candidatus Obscuribacterales bacterium]
MSGATHTLSGTYSYQGMDKAMDAIVQLLVLLKTTGVCLTDINVDERRGIFRRNGDLEFTVAGTKEEVTQFRELFKAT